MPDWYTQTPAWLLILAWIGACYLLALVFGIYYMATHDQGDEE